MTTLTINKECVKHIPHIPSISVIAYDGEHADKFTFCEECEQNIECFCFYDDDMGIVWTKWKVSA